MAKVASDKSETIQRIPLACADETAAVEMLEDMRWGEEPACPHCGGLDVYKMQSRNGGRNSRYLWRCRECEKQYTVRVGTVMEDSPIPLHVWCFAFWAACASKKGVSALQIKRQTGLSYKSALFLMHRIRWAMAGNGTGPLDGDVEADVTFVGGKPRKLSKHERAERKAAGIPRKRGFSAEARKNKTPVSCLIERNGEARTRVPADVTGETLGDDIREQVNASARLHTDEAASYVGIGKEMASHHSVNHSEYEYARWDDGLMVTVNTAESFFSLFKRGIVGTFHNVSRKHLHRYASEFEFRWNTRKMDDGARFRAAIRAADGKRLMYRHP